ncbi:MAG: FliG C-terminal domain-containing protein [Roseovarius sp.]
MPSTELASLSLPSRAGTAARRLTRRQKAAIVVRYLLSEGADLPIAELPEPLQEVLTTQMGSMRYVDRTTLSDVIGEFTEEIEAMGLTFPGGIAGALSALDGRISPQTALRLRKEAGVRQFGDPWAQVCRADPAKLLEFLETEGTEVAAVLLSKLDVTLAAKLLGRLPGATARRITYAVSLTSAATPDAVDRIGLSLAAQLHAVPPVAFEKGPDQRVGEILNYSETVTREDVLEGLEETDSEFARLVRRAIFTFANIPDRVKPVDVPNILRDVPRQDIATALSTAMQGDEDLVLAANFLLDNLSKRMSDTLRDEIEERGPVSERNGEAAMKDIIAVIRQMEADGEIKLVMPEDDAPTPPRPAQNGSGA